MASSPYLSHYGIYKETEEFKFTFYIPDNCGYTVAHDSTNNIYTIAVSLNPSEKGPSPVFTDHYFMVECDTNGNVEVDFELPEVSGGLGLAKKPRLIVSDLRL